MESKRIRKIKLHGKYRQVKRGWGGVEWQKLPWLNVHGLWLEQAGFKAGDMLQIEVAQDTLTIKNCSTDGATGY